MEKSSHRVIVEFGGKHTSVKSSRRCNVGRVIYSNRTFVTLSTCGCVHTHTVPSSHSCAVHDEIEKLWEGAEWQVSTWHKRLSCRRFRHFAWYGTERPQYWTSTVPHSGGWNAGSTVRKASAWQTRHAYKRHTYKRHTYKRQAGPNVILWRVRRARWDAVAMTKRRAMPANGQCERVLAPRNGGPRLDGTSVSSGAVRCLSVARDIFAAPAYTPFDKISSQPALFRSRLRNLTLALSLTHTHTCHCCNRSAILNRPARPGAWLCTCRFPVHLQIACKHNHSLPSLTVVFPILHVRFAKISNGISETAFSAPVFNGMCWL